MGSRRTRNAIIPIAVVILGTALVSTLATRGVSAVQAQTRDGADTNPKDGGADQSGSRFFVLLAKKRPAFSLMSGHNSVTARRDSKISPTALNLQVIGGGTLGRLPKWTGFNASNAFIGDCTIFEGKNRLVVIGPHTPTSKLTVGGAIQITQGGLKFSDGTVLMSGQVGVPFILRGSVPSPLDAVIEATNTASGGTGMISQGGDGIGNTSGGTGVVAVAGHGDLGGNGEGGAGLSAVGGGSSSAAGPGVVGFGGDALSQAHGGNGLQGFGGIGAGPGKRSGSGLLAISGQAFNGAATGFAGNFVGDVQVSGNLSKGGGSFKIDHPMHSENKYLFHSFVESPDMMNIYNGNVKVDANGEAVVELPDWFSALNRDFRYLLTAIGAPSPALYIAEEIADNRFKIAGGAPGMKVSWQVTGIRQDAWANKNRIKVEVEKDDRERGFYLHPEVFNQPEERGIQWVQHPEMMQQTKQRREEFLKTHAGKQSKADSR